MVILAAISVYSFNKSVFKVSLIEAKTAFKDCCYKISTGQIMLKAKNKKLDHTVHAFKVTDQSAAFNVNLLTTNIFFISRYTNADLKIC